MKTMFEKVARVGRSAVLLLGLAVILAAVFGVASMAFAAKGKPLILGKGNVASKITKLVKKGAGPALDLRVKSGPPLRVNSAAQVANLNADKVDGLDSGAFFSGETYFVDGPSTDNSAADNTTASAFCDVGDIVIGGGYRGLQPDEGTMMDSRPNTFTSGGDQFQGWDLFWKNAAPSLDSNVTARAHCADFPPLR